MALIVEEELNKICSVVGRGFPLWDRRPLLRRCMTCPDHWLCIAPPRLLLRSCIQCICVAVVDQSGPACMGSAFQHFNL